MTHETSKSWKAARKRDDVFASLFSDRTYFKKEGQPVMKHTPGPWRVEADGVEIGPKGAFRPFSACGCCGSPWMMANADEIKEADAKLIAAAPDLLLALQKLLREVKMGGHDWPVRDDAEDAIKKATQ